AASPSKPLRMSVTPQTIQIFVPAGRPIIGSVPARSAPLTVAPPTLHLLRALAPYPATRFRSCPQQAGAPAPRPSQAVASPLAELESGSRAHPAGTAGAM